MHRRVPVRPCPACGTPGEYGRYCTKEGCQLSREEYEKRALAREESFEGK